MSKEKVKDPAAIEKLKLTPCITSALVNSRQWVARGSWSLSITGGVAILALECSSHSGGAHTAPAGGHEPTETQETQKTHETQKSHETHETQETQKTHETQHYKLIIYTLVIPMIACENESVK